MKRNYTEIFIGSIVLLITIVFVIFAYKKAELKTHIKGYNITAKFQQIDGISVGSEIKLSGIKIGEVTRYNLDCSDYRAIVTFNIYNEFKIPLDSSAQIVSDGLLGGKYVSISPGADAEFMKSGDELIYTQSSINIENLIGKMVFGSDKK
ncbi:MAG: outer membrane lipid asymmetry maintenance protein MlaD [Rickettsiales bacterium]|nr:MAG: outer membrane lipid asymmetry maintenance protein MlaD [Rickettsiales bacterium]